MDLTVDLITALCTLQAAGRIEKPWHAGMLYRRRHGVPGPLVRVGDDAGSQDIPTRSSFWEPVLSDPCTAGGLLALLREASGDPYLSPVSYTHGAPLSKLRAQWALHSGHPCRDAPKVFAADEAEVIAAALVQLASEAQRDE